MRICEKHEMWNHAASLLPLEWLDWTKKIRISRHLSTLNVETIMGYIGMFDQQCYLVVQKSYCKWVSSPS